VAWIDGGEQVAQTSSEWLDGQADRISARHRAQVETAKLIATFSTAIAATLTATALQVGTPSGWDRVAVVLLFVTALLTVAVVIADRLAEPDHTHVLEEATHRDWDDAALLTELQVAGLAATSVNRQVVNSVRVVTICNLVAALLTSVFAVVSLLT
jgi:hypothetical protein